MATDSFSDLDDSRDAAMDGPEIPLFEEWFGMVGGLIVEVLEGETDLVGARGFQIGVDDVQGVELFPLALGEVLMRFQLLRHGVLEEDVTAVFEFGMVFAFQSANYVDGVVDQADDMEFVEGDLGVGQAGGDPLGEGLRQVGADFGDGFGIAAVRLEVFCECRDGG